MTILPVITYWVTGCLVVGAMIGTSMRDYPNDAAPKLKFILALVAVWPMIVSIVLFSWGHLPAIDRKNMGLGVDGE